MIKSAEIIPLENEAPSSYAERLSIIVSGNKSALEKRMIGQYFTPSETARLMTSFLSGSKELSSVSILDPGAGTAVLSCAVIEKLSESKLLKEIKLVCYETDPLVLPYTRMSLDYLGKTLSVTGIKFSYRLCEKSFTEDNKDLFEQS
jgi:adenine-specific DNA-methyltransferase